MEYGNRQGGWDIDDIAPFSFNAFLRGHFSFNFRPRRRLTLDRPPLLFPELSRRVEYIFIPLSLNRSVEVEPTLLGTVEDVEQRPLVQRRRRLSGAVAAVEILKGIDGGLGDRAGLDPNGPTQAQRGDRGDGFQRCRFHSHSCQLRFRRIL